MVPANYLQADEHGEGGEILFPLHEAAKRGNAEWVSKKSETYQKRRKLVKFSKLKDSSHHANDENEDGKGYRVLRILLNFFLKFDLRINHAENIYDMTLEKRQI